MPRAYFAVDADKPLIATALEEAGYPVSQFGTLAYTEDGKRFVNFGRRRYDKSFTKTYECPGDEWVSLALADLDAGEFGRK